MIVKRSCRDGRFMLATTRALGCEMKPPASLASWWSSVWKKDDAGPERVCYPTKRQAMRAFLAANVPIAEAWGLDKPASGGEFDAVNERLGLKGKHRVVTLGAAIAAAFPPGEHCLSAVDMDMLNDTTPGRELGPFRLPDIVEEARMWEAYQRDREAS